MSISDTIAPHIPFLRRFARALCGTQAAGDAYVAATLEEILADPGCFDADLEPKVALYKLFLRCLAQRTPQRPCRLFLFRR